jgi:hypothetical protein
MYYRPCVYYTRHPIIVKRALHPPESSPQPARDFHTERRDQKAGSDQDENGQREDEEERRSR